MKPKERQTTIHRRVAVRCAVAAGAAVCLPSLLMVAHAAQKPATPAHKTAAASPATHNVAPSKPGVPRRPDGRPDLSGVWSFATVTPLERPAEFAGKAVLTDKEAEEFEKLIIAKENKDNREGGADADVSRAYNDFWWDRGTKVVGTRRTSLIIDPLDGKIPPLTAEAQAHNASVAKRLAAPPNGPEDRNLSERCLLGFNSGPPMLPSAYNNNVHIAQTKDTVLLLNEMIHNSRIVPLDGRPHGRLLQWVGDSRGRWDGDTLVVDTINFSVSNFRNASPRMHLVERFTRVDAETLMYEFTVEDPSTWTRPWTVQLPMSKSSEPMYEYACHEGNYAMEGMLSGARAKEKAEKEGKEQ
jgi:hypothetical protein